MAEDGKYRRGVSLKATTSVLVHIIDENDNGPVFQPGYTFHVSEAAVKNHQVGQVTATDKDAGPNGRVTYRILAGNSDNR